MAEDLWLAPLSVVYFFREFQLSLDCGNHVKIGGVAGEALGSGVVTVSRTVPCIQDVNDAIVVKIEFALLR